MNRPSDYPVVNDLDMPNYKPPKYYDEDESLFVIVNDLERRIKILEKLLNVK